MPYKPIDPNEKVTATPGGTTSQPVAQTGVATGGVGGAPASSGGIAGSSPKMDNNYTNLTSYLQANAGNNQTADDVNQRVFNPLAQNVASSTEGTAGATEAKGVLHSAVQGVQNNTPNTQAAIQQTYGNTWGNQAGGGGKAALDTALGYRGIANQARATEAGAKAKAYVPPPEEQLSTPKAPSGFAVSAPNPVTGGTGVFDPGASGAGDIGVDHTPELSSSLSQARPVSMAQLQSLGPSSGGYGHSATGLAPGDHTPQATTYSHVHGGDDFLGIYRAHGGTIPEENNPQPFSKLMQKMRNK